MLLNKFNYFVHCLKILQMVRFTYFLSTKNNKKIKKKKNNNIQKT